MGTCRFLDRVIDGNAVWTAMPSSMPQISGPHGSPFFPIGIHGIFLDRVIDGNAVWTAMPSSMPQISGPRQCRRFLDRVVDGSLVNAAVNTDRPVQPD